MAIELPKVHIPPKMLKKVNTLLGPTRMKILQWRTLDDNITRLEEAVKEHEMQLDLEVKALKYLYHKRKQRDKKK